MHWTKPQYFFDPTQIEGSPIEELMAEAEHVWDIVDKLGPFIQRTVCGNVSELRSKGDLLTQAAAILDGQVYWGVTYELGDPARKQLKIWHQGELIPEAALVMPGVALIGSDIEIGAGALVESGAMLKAPTIIGPRSEVRQGAYVRGGVMSSPGAIIGHATEVKNALFMPGAKAGHFAYIGDSILGHGVNLGAGTRLANLKMNSAPYLFNHDGETFRADRRKLGAIIGDHSETGCNTVTNPGTLLEPKSRTIPNSTIGPGFRAGKVFLKR